MNKVDIDLIWFESSFFDNVFKIIKQSNCNSKIRLYIFGDIEIGLVYGLPPLSALQLNYNSFYNLQLWFQILFFTLY